MVALRTSLFSLFVPGMVALGLPYLYLEANAPVTPPPPASVAALAGTCIFGLGVGLYCWCASEFTVRGKGTPLPLDPPKALVVKGPYRWTRNPMYVAVLTTILGETAFFRSLPLLTYALLLFAIFTLFIMAFEEPTLQDRFGDAYTAYRQSVPRWVRLWPR
jgi:protein-S-isoprenylcysteine O-methyltransferase Ste14